MKKALIITLAFILSLSLFGCVGGNNINQNHGSQQPADANSEDAVAKVVQDFGKKLQEVSLLAPAAAVQKSMEESYAQYVSPSLLQKWQKDFQKAPGRLGSSPWPDHIEITAVTKVSDGQYIIKGKIIEITSKEQKKGGIAAQKIIDLVVRKINDKWLIDDVTLGGYEEKSPVVYQNEQYGFSFTLPQSWQDYTIAMSKWEGLSMGGERQQVISTGPIISIRNPKWTEANPYQDIPIMVFTTAQWKELQQAQFHIGAAPIGPSELGHNSSYVFALPARYNFAFPAGVEEVENILKGNPFKAMKVK
jgi:hypothetical protein